ncbi:MAG: tripartite tricarboxylate transporter substrate binding protein [Alphaproteobacteria bacterium]|nr:tripartite tricarboxylate transporter substrate binding protein [Alphaproteobacteria bacterium]
MIARRALPALLATPALAQSRPIRLVAPFPPGGGVDAVARLLAEPFGGALGQTVVVENRAGAGGAIGVEAVAQAAPDGTSLVMVSPGNMTVAAVLRPLPYEPLAMGMVARLCLSPLLLVARNSLPAADLAAFIALLRREPDAVRFASGGVATGTHMAGELLNLRMGARMVHVPYRGTAPAIIDMIAGNVDVFFSDTSAWPMAQQGQVRLLAVSTATRWTVSPATPSMADAVPGFDIANWYGVVAPPGTPEAARLRQSAALAQVLARPDMQAGLLRLGFEAAHLPPAQLAEFIRAETGVWRGVVQAANIRAE